MATSRRGSSQSESGYPWTKWLSICARPDLLIRRTWRKLAIRTRWFLVVSVFLAALVLRDRVIAMVNGLVYNRWTYVADAVYVLPGQSPNAEITHSFIQPQAPLALSG